VENERRGEGHLICYVASKYSCQELSMICQTEQRTNSQLPMPEKQRDQRRLRWFRTLPQNGEFWHEFVVVVELFVGFVVGLFVADKRDRGFVELGWNGEVLLVSSSCLSMTVTIAL